MLGSPIEARERVSPAEVSPSSLSMPVPTVPRWAEEVSPRQSAEFRKRLTDAEVRCASRFKWQGFSGRNLPQSTL